LLIKKVSYHRESSKGFFFLASQTGSCGNSRINLRKKITRKPNLRKLEGAKTAKLYKIKGRVCYLPGVCEL